MRVVKALKITEAVKKMCMEATYDLGDHMMEIYRKALETEVSPLGKKVLEKIIENAEIGLKEQMPVCQDCGFAVFFVDIGQDVHITGSDIREAVNEGVRQGYDKGYMRKSMCHPFTRVNTGDNTPAVIHFDIVPGNKVRIAYSAKGGGSTNMSRCTVLPPAAGYDGVKEYVINRIRESGGNPCPPTIVGVGIGGNFEHSSKLAKKALMRKVGEPNPDPFLAKMEREILEEINKTGIGPMGLGGRVTSFAVQIEMEACHIASLPVAVNLNCHANRHREVTI